MIKNFFSRTRRSKRWRARAEKMWTTKIFEDFFFIIDPIYLLRTRIVTQSLPTIWGRWWFWTEIKILTLGINRTNLMRTKVFLWFHFETGFWSWKPGSSVYKCLYYLGCQEIHKLYYFLYFLDISDFCCNFWLNTETNYW